MRRMPQWLDDAEQAPAPKAEEEPEAEEELTAAELAPAPKAEAEPKVAEQAPKAEDLPRPRQAPKAEAESNVVEQAPRSIRWCRGAFADAAEHSLLAPAAPAAAVEHSLAPAATQAQDADAPKNKKIRKWLLG